MPPELILLTSAPFPFSYPFSYPFPLVFPLISKKVSRDETFMTFSSWTPNTRNGISFGKKGSSVGIFNKRNIAFIANIYVVPYGFADKIETSMRRVS